MKVELYNSDIVKILEKEDIYQVCLQTSTNTISWVCDNKVCSECVQVICNVKSFYEYDDTWESTIKKCIVVNI